MKVLMTTDAVGGVWTYCMELMQALRRKDVQFVLATMGAPPTDRQEMQARRAGATLVVGNYRLEWMDDPWAEVQLAGDWLLALEREHQPDLVHLNGYCHGALSWQAPTLMVAHSCVLSWWQAVKHELPPQRYDRYRHEVAAGLHAANVVIAPTAAMLQSIQQHYGTLAHARVIPNARQPRLFEPAVKEPLVLAAGRLWDEAKNIRALEAAATQISWPVYLAGDDHHPQGLTVAHQNVVCLGKLCEPGMAHWMGRASIYVMPARYEPFGLSVLEAALCGCALVLGDIPSLREVWGDAALFVPPNDALALGVTIESLIRDSRLRAEMAARAREQARRYSPGLLARRYLRLYKTLLAQRQLAHATAVAAGAAGAALVQVLPAAELVPQAPALAVPTPSGTQMPAA